MMMRKALSSRLAQFPFSVSATALGVLLAGAAACTDDARTPADASASELEVPARDVVETHRARQEFPGAVMALQSPSLGAALITSGTTRPDPDGSPVDPDVPWVIGSATKMFVAVAALQLAEEGKLDLDAGLEDMFPSLPRANDITARELLQHTSGLNDYLASPAVLSDLGRAWSPEELLAAALELGAVDEPGGAHHYSNTNYIVLGELIARVAGRPWYEEVRGRILQPLGMTHTHYAGEPSAPPMGPGFAEEGGQIVEATTLAHPSVGGAAGALQSTAPDLIRFARALRDGTLLDERRQAEMQAFVPGEPRGPVGHEYGLGFEKYVIDGVTVYGHAGTALAHASFVGFDPDTSLAIAVVINAGQPAPAPMMALETAAVVTERDITPAQEPPAAAR